MDTALLLVFLIVIIEVYCENTDTPWCKAVIEYIKWWWYFLVLWIIVSVIARVIYFLVK